MYKIAINFLLVTKIHSKYILNGLFHNCNLNNNYIKSIGYNELSIRAAQLL